MPRLANWTLVSKTQEPRSSRYFMPSLNVLQNKKIRRHGNMSVDSLLLFEPLSRSLVTRNIT